LASEPDHDEILEFDGSALVGRTQRDKWTVDAVIGVGGMATVYEATHRNGKQVAIKVLHPHLAALRVDPGPHTLVVSSSRGTSPKRFELRLEEHQSVSRVVDPADLGEPPVPREPARSRSSAAPPSGRASSRTSAYVLGGIGVGALAVSAGTGIAALSKRDAALARCKGKFCDADGLRDADVARTYAWISTATLLGGLASVGAATYLFFSRGPSTSATSIGLGWVSSADDARLLVSGSF
jgi:hypothetical protein